MRRWNSPRSSDPVSLFRRIAVAGEYANFAASRTEELCRISTFPTTVSPLFRSPTALLRVVYQIEAASYRGDGAGNWGIAGILLLFNVFFREIDCPYQFEYVVNVAPDEMELQFWRRFFFSFSFSLCEKPPRPLMRAESPKMYCLTSSLGCCFLSLICLFRDSFSIFLREKHVLPSY